MRPVFRQTRFSCGSGVAKTYPWVRHLGTGKGVFRRPTALAPWPPKATHKGNLVGKLFISNLFFSSPHDPPDILVAASRHDAARDAGQILFDGNHVENMLAKQFGDG